MIFEIFIKQAIDLFDVSEGYSSLNEALAKVKCPTLVMGAQTDILFPVTKQRELAKSLKSSGNNSVTYFEMDSIYGKIFFSKIFTINFHVLFFKRA